MYNFGSKSLSLLISKKPKPNPDTNFGLRHKGSTILKESEKFRVERDDLPTNIYHFYLLEMKGHLDDRWEYSKELPEDVKFPDESVRIALEFEFEILENEVKSQKTQLAWDTVWTPT